MEAPDLKYIRSTTTVPIVDYTDDSNVSEELQDLMNDFVYKVFFSSTSTIQKLLVMKETRQNAKALIASDVDTALATLRKVYVDIAPRISADSVDAAFIGGSRLIVQIKLSIGDEGDSPIVISHAFSTTAGM